MSAAIRHQPIPLFREGLLFWENFTAECRSRVQWINTAIRPDVAQGDPSIRIEDTESEIRMCRIAWPSTEIRATLAFEAWGPVLNASITGQESPARRYATYDLEIPIAHDLDGSVIAIFDEGRSFSAADVARYLMQSFRRCFPGIALPC